MSAWRLGPYEQAPAQFERLTQWAGSRAKRRGTMQEPLLLAPPDTGATNGITEVLLPV